MQQQRAILYVRVSTDEQADKGYSLKHQQERLIEYCQRQQIEIVAVYKEDHSAKTFERPEFTKLLQHVKKNKACADLLLFLKWDRFSRNAADAYYMINQLNKLGVEPQGIEQPLDLNVQENKIMLAFYLAAPEVENDRRALNTIAGMRRAMKEGRHVTMAPKGYRNARNELNKPIIEPSEDAPLVRWIFEEAVKGVKPVMDIWREVVQKGLAVSKSQIWLLLRNPIYYGGIFIPAYKEDAACIVKGSHPPLVSEELFEEVQSVLSGKKRCFPKKNQLQDNLPLRGFLYCKKCGKRLTGSASRGNGGRYFYYHCSGECNERFKAENANEAFVNELSKISYHKEGIALFKKTLIDYYQQSNKSKSVNHKQIEEQIIKNELRLKNARQMLLDGELVMVDYKEMKTELEKTIADLIAQKKQSTAVESNLMEYLNKSVQIIENLPDYFCNADTKGKQQIIGSICPEKLVFENNSYRTTRLNEVLALICSTSKGLGESKKRMAPVFGSHSYQVVPTRIELVSKV